MATFLPYDDYDDCYENSDVIISPLCAENVNGVFYYFYPHGIDPIFRQLLDRKLERTPFGEFNSIKIPGTRHIVVFVKTFDRSYPADTPHRLRQLLLSKEPAHAWLTDLLLPSAPNEAASAIFLSTVDVCDSIFDQFQQELQPWPGTVIYSPLPF
jgi:hypothetical protein